MSFNIIITSNSFGRISNSGMKILQEVCKIRRINLNIPNLENLNKTDLAFIKNTDGIIGSAKKINPQFINTNRLKVIAIRGTGYQALDIPLLTNNKILVINNPGINSISVAELTIGLIINLLRNINTADKELKEGKWNRIKYVGECLHNKTVGIIGLGKIGKEVIKRLSAFETKIIVNTRTIDSKQENFADCFNLKFVSKSYLFRTSDIISLHLPLTKKSENLVNNKYINLMKENSYLINCSRGEIVNKYSLMEALNKNKINGAALDVYDQEPLPKNDKIRIAYNTVLTPHIGSYTKTTLKNMDEKTAKNVKKISQGKLPQSKYIVNKKLINDPEYINKIN